MACILHQKTFCVTLKTKSIILDLSTEWNYFVEKLPLRGLETYPVCYNFLTLKKRNQKEMWGWGVQQNHGYPSVRCFKNAIELYTFTQYLS
jgi:hypothetical protein